MEANPLRAGGQSANRESFALAAGTRKRRLLDAGATRPRDEGLPRDPCRRRGETGPDLARNLLPLLLQQRGAVPRPGRRGRRGDAGARRGTGAAHGRRDGPGPPPALDHAVRRAVPPPRARHPVVDGSRDRRQRVRPSRHAPAESVHRRGDGPDRRSGAARSRSCDRDPRAGGDARTTQLLRAHRTGAAGTGRGRGNVGPRHARLAVRQLRASPARGFDSFAGFDSQRSSGSSASGSPSVAPPSTRSCRSPSSETGPEYATSPFTSTIASSASSSA